MHQEILNANQQSLLPLIKSFSNDFYLVGGTALALYMGHRRSIDFDLFTSGEIGRLKIKRTVESHDFTIQNVLYEAYDQFHISVNSVKLTFMRYEFPVKSPVNFNGIIKLPHIIDLAAMKAYALGGRAKWKDYVDLFFIMKENFPLKDIEKRAKKIFSTLFNAKLFREQLSYFEDIDYTEKIDFMGNEIPESEIRDFLISCATKPL